jgi:chemotaxis protein methyltransferase CheR
MTVNLVSIKSGEIMKKLQDEEFIQLARYIKGNFGVNLTQKRTLIESRLQNILLEKNFESFAQYYEYVVSDKNGDAVISLIDKLTTNHTFFMRESEHFEFFRSTLLPKLSSVYSKEKDLGIWSAGCSTGEEPYTLAMIIHDFFVANKSQWDTKILATDISTRVLQRAVEGVYSNEALLEISDRWKKVYFNRHDQHNSIVADNIKKEVIFRRFNLMNKEFPFKKKFHVIFCRNVMIYFDAETKRHLIEKFYQNLEHGGYLFIGLAESLNFEKTKFKYVMPSVYRKE